MLQSHDTIIVGAGLFGQIIAKSLEKYNGQKVLCIDSAEPESGSLAAACLMKPSWASSMSRGDFDEAMELAEYLYGYEIIPFKVNNLTDVNLYWIPPRKILQSAQVWQDKVLKIERGAPNEWLVHTANHPCFNAKNVIIAAGKWSNEVLALVEPKVEMVPKLTSKKGAAFVGRGTLQPKISVWAPYKQLVAFNRAPDQIWVGDGTALKPESFTAEKLNQSWQRCENFVSQDLLPIVGNRPYADCENNPCYLKEHEAGLWVATGGAKNGTLGALWCGRRLQSAL